MGLDYAQGRHQTARLRRAGGRRRGVAAGARWLRRAPPRRRPARASTRARLKRASWKSGSMARARRRAAAEASARPACAWSRPMLARTTGLSASTCWLRSSVAIASAMRPDRAWQLARPRYGSADGSARGDRRLEVAFGIGRPAPPKQLVAQSQLHLAVARIFADDGLERRERRVPVGFARRDGGDARGQFAPVLWVRPGGAARRAALDVAERAQSRGRVATRWGRRPWRRSSAPRDAVDLPQKGSERIIRVGPRGRAARGASVLDCGPRDRRRRSVRSPASCSMSYSSGRGAAIAFQRPSRMLRSELQPKSSSGANDSA